MGNIYNFRKYIVFIIVFFSAAGVSGRLKANSIAVVSQEIAEAYYEPSYDSQVAASFEESEVIDIISENNGWVVFAGENGNIHMPLESITVIQAGALISNNGAYLLSEPTPLSQVVMHVPLGSVINAVGYTGDYYAVDLGSDSAYIHKNDVIGNLLNYLDEYLPMPTIINLDTGTSSYYAAGVAMIQGKGREYLKVENTTTGLNMRSYPISDAPVLACIPNGNELDIIELGTEWHQVSYDGLSGFVSAKFTRYFGDGTLPEAVKPETSLGIQVVDYAKQFIGTKYKWGGTNLKSGVDCSGFVYSVYKYIGITLNRASKDQIKNGRTVSRSELIPGDLIFFATSGGKTISHVGIYIGNGEFIHSSSSNKRGVVISNLSESYYTNRYVNACRVIK